MTSTISIILIFLSYILGSIPFGLIVTKLFTNIDITKKGSGNIGANNVRRLAGIKLGILTLLLDILKGFLPTFYAIHLNNNKLFIVTVGLLAFLGHLYSIFLKGKGGKGVAVSAGVFLAIAPYSLFLSLIVFVISLFIIRIVAISSIMANLFIILFLYIENMPKEYIALSIIVFAFVIYKHKNNIREL